MTQESHIQATLENAREIYALDNYKADRALITAPFGQEYFDESIQRASDSKAVCELAQNAGLLVLVITSKETDIGVTPDWLQCIQIDKIPGWPDDPSYLNRFFKWGLPFLFQNIKCSIFIDSDLAITNKGRNLNHAFELVEKHHFLSTKHETRLGWKNEHCAILKHRYLNKVRLQQQYEKFVQENIPASVQVCQNNFVGRVHDSRYRELSHIVLEQLLSYSERDQLALVYAIFRTKLMPKALAEGKILFTSFSNSVDENSVCFIENTPRFERIRKASFPSKLKRLIRKNMEYFLKRASPFFGHHRYDKDIID